MVVHALEEEGAAPGAYTDIGVPQWPASLELALDLVTCPGRHHCVYVYHWPLSLHGYLPLVPTAKCMHGTGPRHHQWLPLSPATGPGGTAESHPESPAAPVEPSPCSPRSTVVSQKKSRTHVDDINPFTLGGAKHKQDHD